MAFTGKSRKGWFSLAILLSMLFWIPIAHARVNVFAAASATEPARVCLYHDEVIRVATWGGLSADLRAEIIGNRLQNLLDFGDVHSLRLDVAGPVPVIRSNLGVLATVDENSAALDGTFDTYELAKLWLSRLAHLLGSQGYSEPVIQVTWGEEEFEGTASWYGPGFDGRNTASGERYDMHRMTAAHRSLPFGTRVLVREPSSGKSVIVTINDRGPFVENRVLDLSLGAAEALGIVEQGIAPVTATVLPPQR